MCVDNMFRSGLRLKQTSRAEFQLGLGLLKVRDLLVRLVALGLPRPQSIFPIP